MIRIPGDQICSLATAASVAAMAALAMPASAQTAANRTGLENLVSTAQTGSGEVGQRQTAGASSINRAPTKRLATRIENRINNRVRNRIDRDFNQAQSASASIDATLEQLRGVPDPR